MRQTILLSLLLTLLIGCKKSDSSSNDDQKLPALEFNDPYVDYNSSTTTRYNATTDYSIISSGYDDQSTKIQSAIDEISTNGGGILYFPSGTYLFAEVYMASNVHIIASKDAIFKPYWATNEKAVNMLYFGPKVEADGHLVNCSIRCESDGEKFTVDYSHLNPDHSGEKGDGDNDYNIRFIVVRAVKNFLISDIKILDNRTKYCGVIFSSVKSADRANDEVICGTDGTIRDVAIYDANVGYGMCQLHAAKNLLFENLYADGGVSLRLEVDSGGVFEGLFDICARNIVSEEGYTAVLMAPHEIHNGTIRIDGVTSIGSMYGVLMREGFIEAADQGDDTLTNGTYASDSEIQNVHATSALTAQINRLDTWVYDSSVLKQITAIDNYSNIVYYTGPSLAPVYDETKDSYTVTVQGVTQEGFISGYDGVLKYTEMDTSALSSKWDLINYIEKYYPL
ncbi:MAG: glycosyl hydrolase family 28-related protein [Rikenellaceae bacterium]